MQERNSPLRFFVHMFTAALIAAAVAGGTHLWLTNKATRATSTAELSLDPDAARKIDPGLADAAEPATALAQSYLTDQVVAGLSKQAWLSTAEIPTRIGEFRSRLELTQPSSGRLQVEFRDPDVSRAASTANAVARALVAWAPPSAAAAPVPAATAPPTTPAPAAATPAPVPAPKPVASPQPQDTSALAAGLSALEAQLSSTNRKLDELSSSGGRAGSHYGGYGREQSSYSESEQQRLIKTNVGAARKKFDDLRTQATKESLRAGTKEHLAAIQEALSSVLAPQGSGFRAAGIDARQLRRERAALTNTISVVAEQRQAIEKEEAAQAAPATSPTPQPAAAAITPAPTPAPAQPQAAPVAPAASPGAAQQSPFAEVRLAGPGARVMWWPSLALGLLCTLPYLIAVSLRRRPAEDETDDTSVTPRSGSRFITPDEPVRAAPPAPASNPFVSTPGRRASFSWDPDPSQNAAPAKAPAIYDTEIAQAEAEARGVSVDPPASIRENSAPVQEMPAPVQENPAPVKDDPASVRENVVAMTDPWDSWTIEIRKTLAETTIGRALAGSDAASNSGEAANPESDATPRPATRPDRLAG